MQSLQNLSKTMTVKDFAIEYGLGLNKAYELVNTKDFPKLRCGRKIIIIRTKVDEWLSRQVGKQF